MAEHLKRRIGLGLLAAYGVGVMVGAGIYVLVGAVAGQAGIWAPLAFLGAGLIAAPSALSYAELSTRLPEAAGEAAYVQQGLNSRVLAVVVGLAIVAAGTISAAAVLRGGAGYLTAITALPAELTIVVMGLALIAVAVLGALESLAVAAVFTVIELAGLALVIWAGGTAAPSPDWVSGGGGLVWSGVAAGAVLAFFAFIGFEDIVNMAEEVRRPTYTLPRAILLALVITSLIYGAVSWAAVRAVPLAQLAGSEQPLALVWQTRMGGPASFLSAIAVAAALNGVLAQIVMASRVLFGLGKDGGPLGLFHHAHPRFGTPALATLLVGALVVIGALGLPVAILAEVTSTILLAVFVLVNAALIGLKRRTPQAVFRVPMAVPVVGLILALAAFLATLGGFL
ncbi:amino acid permease [Lutimaribacter sp. EGI FJ00015]|uniref:Amino acid permease n=1 Tax=Lutimaribacter degradans TaxID=2945989 RepID=A0ACC5ZRB2_9RHOB|nr:amino acid permease [Lutimaribacter sp. EGI FJ00013]MCM2560685.1 amino acid permease [Lutimaribacter sp. EGI FJ00013]MCO0612371.1 amino acid permease [Lutimaribacter sp. EGI FJ00015]MCO0634509.1 amino acid permease [Lutimaribacter sp. EGI FJ00014]